MNQKQDVILKHLREYEEKLIEVSEGLDEITAKPKYKLSQRRKVVLTEEVIERLSSF